MAEYLTGESIQFDGDWTEGYPDSNYTMLLSNVGSVCSVSGFITGGSMSEGGVSRILLLPESWTDNPSGGSAAFRDTRNPSRGELVGWVVADPEDHYLYLILAPEVSIVPDDIIGLHHHWTTRP